MIPRLMRLLTAAALALSPLAAAEPAGVRVVAANLTSGRHPSYSPDNGNHTNPEGAGARILKALKPDIALMQEFNTSVPLRSWVNATFGKEFHVMREDVKGIPNGIVSRFPIVASGHWDDPVLDNREFAWARLRLPDGRELWAVSVHLHSKNATSRERQSRALIQVIEERVPAGALLIVGGDLNTRTTREPCFAVLSRRLAIPAEPPHDGQGNIHTNVPRSRPYDWVLTSPELDRREVPVRLGGHRFEGGLVFDTRVFTPLDAVPPVRETDSGLPMMQHMAVVRDFVLPPP